MPHDDPTLLFVNAGMNQYKPCFLGRVEPGSDLEGLTRAVNSQKCIRAGGKHNDLEDVGLDTYHHTFFEMLGNWSFGDYFKAEAIDWAFALLTGNLDNGGFEIDPNRLYATYFGGDPKAGLEPDHEARDLWLKHLPADHVLPGSFKDNFWEMGETGPCGPCSELHYDRIGDRNAASLVNQDDPNVLEIWNLVFIQYDRQKDRSLKTLPAKHVDTGMGLERLVSVIQNTTSNYDTDLFLPIFEAIRLNTKAPHEYQGRLGKQDPQQIDTAYRVIADHLRTLCFAIADGATPSNEGRGYVLRRVLRRAARFGRQMLGAQPGFFSKLVPTLVDVMGDAWPELAKHQAHIIELLLEEEVSFGKTLDKGLLLLSQAADKAGHRFIAETGNDDIPLSQRARRYVSQKMDEEAGISSLSTSAKMLSTKGIDWKEFEGKRRPCISGQDAFQLYDTFGFPLDLTQLMASERGLSVDVAGFEKCMEEQRERSRAGAKTGGEDSLVLDPESLAKLRYTSIKPTDDSDKHHGRSVRSRVVAIWNGHDFDENAQAVGRARQVGVLLDRTPFYAEAGGQVADRGRLHVTHERSIGDHHGGGEFRVEDVRSFGGYVLHIGLVTKGELRVGDELEASVDRARRTPTQANHTATHLLNLALREALGDHVAQKGSLVEPDRLRFDFSHKGPMNDGEIAAVEAKVQSLIDDDLKVSADIASLHEAQTINSLRAVFGEKYPDPVRVVSIGATVPMLLATPDNEQWNQLSIEFCGGTHLQSTGQAGGFALVSETGIAKGVRRIEAVTGVAAQAAHNAATSLETQLEQAASQPSEQLAATIAALSTQIDQLTLPLPRKKAMRTRLESLQDTLKAASKAAAGLRRQHVEREARSIAEGLAGSLDPVVVATIDAGDDRQALQAALKVVCAKLPRTAVMLMSVEEGGDKPGVAIIAACPKELITRGVKAGDWVREAAAVLGGKGGGRPEQAQGGGPDTSKIREAVKAARMWALKALNA